MKTFIIILLLPVILFAQGENFQWEPEGIPYEINGWQPWSPWTGGNKFATPELVDIDADGDYDLFIGSDIYHVTHYENIGDSCNAIFHFITDNFDSITAGSVASLLVRPVFVDIDADNDQDIILWTGQQYQIFYRNDGTIYSQNYVLITQDFLSQMLSGYGGADFIDIDDDGDYDILEGDWNGTLHYYENLGNSQAYNYQNVVTNFFDIDVGGIAHPSMCDIDADNDYDLFIGNDDGYIYYYRNDGDSVNYDFVFVTDTFADASVYSEATPTFCDIDGDDDYDLFVGMEWARYPYESGNVAFYENVGSPQAYDFNHVTDNYLCFDIGVGCSPLLADVDDDGDLDMVCGGGDQKIPFIENVGDAINPSFEWKEMIWGGAGGFLGASIAVGDLDADNDYDMMVGTSNFMNFYITWFKNVGTPDSAVFRIQQQYLISTVEWWLSPSLVDIDDDGDLDLIVETEENSLNSLLLYENIGSPAYANFNLNSQELYTFNESIYDPTFFDYDSDGDYDIFAPSYFYGICYYENIGSSINPIFQLITLDFAGLSARGEKAALGDIDNDGDFDLFLGTNVGGIKFYRNQFNPSPPVLSITLSYPDVILQWHPIAGAVQYKIFYQDNPYFTPSGAAQAFVNPPDTSYTDSGAINYGMRFYRVVAGN